MLANSAKRKVTIDVNGRKTPVRVGDTIELDFGWRGLVVGFETWTLDAGSFYPGLKIVVQAYNEEAFGPDAPRHKRYYTPESVLRVL